MDNSTLVAEKLVSDAVLVKSIDYNPLWRDAEGYYPGAETGEHAPELSIGQTVTAVTDTGLKLLILGTQLGNAVVFQRDVNHVNVIAWSAPAALVGFIEKTIPNAAARVTEDLYDYLVGMEPYKSNNVSVAFANAPVETRNMYYALIGKEAESQEQPQPAASEQTTAQSEQPKAAEAPEPEKAKQSTNNEKESTMKSTTKAATAKTNDLTSWGVFWRAAGLTTLILAIIVALIFGLHFGAAYIGGLGLSEGVKIALGYFLTFTAYLGIGFTVSKGIDWFGNLFSRRAPAKAPAAPMAAAAA